jgi:hypothetical protein
VPDARLQGLGEGDGIEVGAQQPDRGVGQITLEISCRHGNIVDAVKDRPFRLKLKLPFVIATIHGIEVIAQ